MLWEKHPRSHLPYVAPDEGGTRVAGGITKGVERELEHTQECS